MSLTSEQESVLRQYAQAVTEAPRNLSLTATRDPKEFWNRHVCDALALIDLIPEDVRKTPLKIMDVGSGNGVPGVVLAIAMPGWYVNMLDSNSKKCGFIDMFLKFNSVRNGRVLLGRAEVLGQDPEYREQQHVAFARALSKLPTAIEFSAAFVKVGGAMIVPHGTSVESELMRSKNTMKEMGVEFRKILTYYENYQAVIMDKVYPTPSKYPRGIGIPEKKPL